MRRGVKDIIHFLCGEDYLEPLALLGLGALGKGLLSEESRGFWMHLTTRSVPFEVLTWS